MYPHLLTLGRVSVPTYGVFAAIALVAGLVLAMRTAARLHLSPDSIWNLGLISIVAAVIGSKLLFIFSHWNDFLSYPLLMLTVRSAPTVNSLLTELGLGIFAGLLYMTLKRMPWLSSLDAIAPGWALGQAILALGCFFAGCEFGRVTAMPWGVVFDNPWAAYWNGTPLGIKLHPVQLYFCVLHIGLCVLLLWWLPRRKQPGELAGIWMLLFGFAEFLLDFYRGAERLLLFANTVSLVQIIDFFLVVLGALFLMEQHHPKERIP